MNDRLDPEVRRLLDAALPGLSPSEASKARAREALASLGPVDAPMSSHHSGDDLVRSRVSKWFSLGRHTERSAWFLGGVIVGAAGGVALGYHLTTARPLSAQVANLPAERLSEEQHSGSPSSPPPLPAPSASSPATQTATPEAVSTHEHQRRPTRAAQNGSVAAAPASPPAIGGNDDEVGWVLRAQKALARGEPQLALGILRELDARIPHGRLGEERAACRAVARCASTPAQGGAEREAFVSRYPTSIHLERVERSCSVAKPHPDVKEEKP